MAELSVDEETAILRGARASTARERDAAFEHVYRALRDRVLTLGLYLTGNDAEAQDALQETFVAVYRALPDFRGEARLSTWILRIATHAAFRIRARRPPTEPAPELEPEPAQTAAVLDAREDARRVLRAMQALSVEHRTVLSLFAIEALTHAQIAEILGVPEGTVWSRLHAARKRMTQWRDVGFGGSGLG